MKPLLHNKIIIGAIAAVSFLPNIINAQEAVTLNQAVATAISQHPALRSSELDLQIAEIQLTSEKSSRIPEISSGLSVQRNLIIPSTPVPLAIISGQGDPDELTYIKFGTDWQSNVGLSLSYDIFNPARKQQIISGEEQRKLAEIDLKAKKVSVRIDVTKAYAELVLASAQLEYALEDTVFNHRVLMVAKDQDSLGQINEKQLNDSRLRLNQSLSRYSQTKKVYEQARIDLAYYMGLQYNYASLPVAADNLEKLFKSLEAEALKVPLAKTSSDYARLQTQMQYDSLQLSNIRRMMLPTISLIGNYGSNFYQNQFNPFNTSNWYGNSYVALSLNIPITKNIATHYNISKTRLQLDRLSEDIKDFNNRRKSDIQKITMDINQSRAEMVKKEHEIKLEEENLNTATEQFNAGRLLPNNLQQEQLSLQSARIAYLQASYDYIIALLNLRELTASE
ncbi:MAG: TolC family protein [Marinilabiliaceae bacterium]|jgi:outer membrane protein TolC|nr:TolC family protein [Marinilabiliaceae bacterium]